MAKRRHIMGLHTKSEREQAYSLAKRAYDTAIKRGLLAYGLGYIEAVSDLLKQEAPEDQEFLDLLMDMYGDLSMRLQEG